MDEKEYLKMFESMTSSNDFRNFKESEIEEFTVGNQETEQNENSYSQRPVPIDETFHFKSYAPKRTHRYTEKELNEIRNNCQEVIVNDYGLNDIFHVSDEEKLKNDQLAEISMKLMGVKSVYHRVDQYIEAMRIVYRAWEILSQNNFIRTKKEFFKLIGEGKIVSNRIIIPQLKQAKKYNQKLILEYISNPELDASIFAPTEEDEDKFLTDEEIDDQMERILSTEDLLAIEEHNNNPKMIQVETVKPKFLKRYLEPNKKKKESFNQKVFNSLMNKERSTNRNSVNNLFSQSLFDANKKEFDPYDRVHFKGSWRNKNDVKLFDMMVDESRQFDKNGGFSIENDKSRNEFFDELAKNGVDSIELRKSFLSNKKETSLKESKKEFKKEEKMILSKILELNNNKKFNELCKKAESSLSKYYEKGDK